jgi:hypothetical protein
LDLNQPIVLQVGRKIKRIRVTQGVGTRSIDQSLSS